MLLCCLHGSRFCLPPSYVRYCVSGINLEKLFVLEAVMPELIGNYFTQPSNVSTTNNNENLEPVSNFPVCFCGNQNSGLETIKCANLSCQAKEYHVSCLIAQGKKRFPNGWQCDVCKKCRARSSKGKRNPLSVKNK